MKLGVEIIITVLIMVFGYVYTSFYLNEMKWKKENISALKMDNRFKVLYLISAVLVSGILIFLFHYIYIDGSLLHHMKLIILVNLIFPMAIIDFKLQKIPNQLLLTALVLRAIIYIFEFVGDSDRAFSILIDNVVGAVIIGVFFLLLLLLFKNSIGMGDIKLFMIMGLYQGIWGAINSVFFSLLVSFFLSIVLLITRKKGRKDTISFGPSILIGTVIAIGLAGI